MSIFTFDRIESDGIVLLPNRPISFHVRVCQENSRFVEVSDVEFNIEVIASDHHQLMEEVQRAIVHCWQEYAMEWPHKLTQRAAELGRRYRELFSVEIG